MFNRKKGFTLIELMIVMAIIAILAVIGIAAVQTARRSTRDTQRRSNTKTIQTALEAYYVANKNYPELSGNSGPSPGPFPIIKIGYFLTCSDPCVSGNPIGPSGPLNRYISGDLKDPGVLNAGWVVDPGNLKGTSSWPQTLRYYYHKIDSDSYCLGVATEVKRQDELGASAQVTWKTASYWEDFSIGEHPKPGNMSSNICP